MTLPSNFNSRLRDGDGAIAGWVFEEYSRRLSALAARNIGGRLQQRFAPEDAVQSAFASFFRRAQRGEFSIDDSTDLWNLLARIIVLKVRHRARMHSAKKRALGAENVGGEDELNAVAGLDPGPDELVLVQDLIETVLAGFPDSVGEMLALTLQGFTLREVGEQLRVSHMSVKRNLERLRKRLRELEPPAPD